MGGMELSDDLLCVFTGEIENGEDDAVIAVPTDEIDLGDLEPGESYRVAIYGAAPPSEDGDRTPSGDAPVPPVEEGDRVELEIENLGEEGDGIARVDRGYVVIVPDTEQGERVTAEITDVKRNVAFAEVVERHHRVF